MVLPQTETIQSSLLMMKFSNSEVFVVEETYEEDSFHNSLTYTLITVIPASLLLLMVWVCCRMRQCNFYPLNNQRSAVEQELRRRERESEMRRRDMRESLSGELIDNYSTYKTQPRNHISPNLRNLRLLPVSPPKSLQFLVFARHFRPACQHF